MFVDTLTAAVERKGGQINLDCAIRAIEPLEDGRLALSVEMGKRR